MRSDAGRIEVISNGIDLEPFHGFVRRRDGGPLRFSCAAYLGEHKGIPDLLQAAALLTEEPDLVGGWSLTIAGDGHLRPELEAQIASGRFADAVTYLGRVTRDRIIAELASTDVLVLPSRWPENEPVVLLEAIAAGVAQLATDVGGMPELVQKGITGELVPPGDPQALASAMADYIREPDRARRQGEANAARRDRFSEEASIEAIEATYERVLLAPRPQRSSRPLVLCAGDWPMMQTASICNFLYRLEQPCPGIRLVWHEWADPADWEQAVLLWNWSSGASNLAIQRALRYGVPILAPASCTPVSGIESSFGAALTYNSFLEAMLVLARLPHDTAALRLLSRGCTRGRVTAERQQPSGTIFPCNPCRRVVTASSLHIVICNERLLPRFGVDRLLLLLGSGLTERGHRITFLCQRGDKAAVAAIPSVFTEVPDLGQFDLHGAEAAAMRWLSDHWDDLSHDRAPDVVVTGGWPFFNIAKVCAPRSVPSLFIDAGAVPHDGMPADLAAGQCELRRVRAQCPARTSLPSCRSAISFGTARPCRSEDPARVCTRYSWGRTIWSRRCSARRLAMPPTQPLSHKSSASPPRVIGW